MMEGDLGMRRDERPVWPEAPDHERYRLVLVLVAVLR